MTTEELLKEAQETNHKTIGFKVKFQKVNEDSRIPVYIVPTNEELMIAKDTYELIG